MNKIMTYIFAITIIAGCVSGQRVMFEHYESEGDIQKKVRYHLNVPKNYRLVTFHASGEAGREQQYWYPDSSVIYITSMEGLPTINHDNIKKQKAASVNRFGAFINGDTITSSGIDQRGYLWKDIMLNNVSVGYANVRPENESVFDAVLNNIHKK